MITLAQFARLTGFATPADYISYLTQLADDNADSGMECTSDDYRTMAKLVALLPVS